MRTTLQTRTAPAASPYAAPAWMSGAEGTGGPVMDRVPSSAGFVALLAAFHPAGGTAPGEIVAKLLEDHHVGNAVSLAKLLFTAQVFGFEWRGSLWIPMFQFDADDLSIKTGPQAVRAALPGAWPGWTVACWFAEPNAQLAGRRPVDLLESGLLQVAARSAHAAQAPVNARERSLARTAAHA
jgi:hypothetical protein